METVHIAQTSSPIGLVRVASTATGSKGGGRPHFAQGGVGDAGKVLEALEQAGAATIRKLDGKD